MYVVVDVVGFVDIVSVVVAVMLLLLFLSVVLGDSRKYVLKDFKPLPSNYPTNVIQVIFGLLDPDINQRISIDEALQLLV